MFIQAKPVYFIMKIIIIIIAVLFFILGCGYNPKDPVYDTKNNPNNFPKQAILLLDKIDQVGLSQPDSIIEAFSNLYLSEQSLLENNQWKEIVSTLGLKFRYCADLLVEDGIEKYSQAVGYYTLASFARPGDLKLSAKQKLFATLTNELSEYFINSKNNYKNEKLSFTDTRALIDSFKNYYFKDSIHQEFSVKYLKNELLIPLVNHSSFKKDIIDSLSNSDKAFLKKLEVYNFKIKEPLTEFVQPEISLIAKNLIELDSNNFRIELYFIPREKIEEEYTIAFWVDTSDSLDLIQGKASYSPFDFLPSEPTSNWKVDNIYIASQKFSFGTPFVSMSVGLYHKNQGSISYLSQKENGGNLVRLPLE